MPQTHPVDRSFARHAAAAPYLERAEERELAVRWTQERDAGALHRLVESHSRLVLSFAARYRRYGLPPADLAQEGHIGLLEAAKRFDPTRDIRFSTYATWWIRASIQDYVLRNWSIVRGGTSSAQKSLFFNLRRMRAKLAHGIDQGSDFLIYQKIGRTLGVSRQDVETMDARLSAGGDLSLNAPQFGSDDSGDTRVDFLVDSQPLPDKAAETSLDDEKKRDWLKNALLLLTERERIIIQQRRLSEEGATLEQLGEVLRISKERVRQIEQIAIEKLRASVLAQSKSFRPALSERRTPLSLSQPKG